MKKQKTRQHDQKHHLTNEFTECVYFWYDEKASKNHKYSEIDVFVHDLKSFTRIVAIFNDLIFDWYNAKRRNTPEAAHQN